MKFYGSLIKAIKLYGQFKYQLGKSGDSTKLVAVIEFEQQVLTGKVDYRDWLEKYTSVDSKCKSTISLTKSKSQPLTKTDTDYMTPYSSTP